MPRIKQDELTGLGVPALREKLRSLNLSPTGVRDKLLERIRAAGNATTTLEPKSDTVELMVDNIATLTQLVNALQVLDDTTHKRASKVLQLTTKVLDEIDEEFEPNFQRWKKIKADGEAGRKAAQTQWWKYRKPVEALEEQVKDEINRWVLKEHKRKQAEEQSIRAAVAKAVEQEIENNKAENEISLADRLDDAYEQGDELTVVQLEKEMFGDIEIDKPVVSVAALVDEVLPPTVRKVIPGSSSRIVHEFTITDDLESDKFDKAILLCKQVLDKRADGTVEYRALKAVVDVYDSMVPRRYLRFDRRKIQVLVNTHGMSVSEHCGGIEVREAAATRKVRNVEVSLDDASKGVA